MDRNGLKKAGALGVLVVLVLFFVTVITLYTVLGAPWPLVAVVATVYIVVVAVLTYHVGARFREIDEGIDDAVDNY